MSLKRNSRGSSCAMPRDARTFKRSKGREVRLHFQLLCPSRYIVVVLQQCNSNPEVPSADNLGQHQVLSSACCSLYFLSFFFFWWRYHANLTTKIIRKDHQAPHHHEGQGDWKLPQQCRCTNEPVHACSRATDAIHLHKPARHSIQPGQAV